MVGIANSLNISQQGTVYFDGLGVFTGIDASTLGFVLTSNGIGIAPSFQTVGAGGSVTIAGDSGSITGSSLTIYANNAANNAGSTVSFINSGTTSTLNITDALLNTFIGLRAGNLLVSGQFNTSLGRDTQSAIVDGASNTSVGSATLANNVSGNENVAFGSAALQSTTGSSNTAIGANSLASLSTGSYNTCLGYNTGTLYSGSESSNICIGVSVTGSVGESSVTRIGEGQAKCYVSGIVDVIITNQQTVSIDSATGQLGAQTGSPHVVIKTVNVDLKTVASTLLFTASADFVVTAIYSYGLTIVGIPNAILANFGTNGATYDNIINGTSSFPSIQGYVYGDVLGATFNQSVIVGSGIGCYINVTNADVTSTTNTQRIDVLGYYL